MKKLIILIGLCATMCSCHSAQKPSNQDITVSISPIKYIVEQIIGNDFTIHTLVPQGVSPESYDPTPQQIILLANSKFIFATGLIDFELQLTDKISDSGQSVVELNHGIDLIKGACTHGGHHNHGVDPHIWTSPRLLKVMAKNVYDIISVSYPDSTKYATNYQHFLNAMDSLDVKLRMMINNSGIKSFIIYHPALTYYAQDYDIEQIALETDGKEPTVEQLKQIISSARIDGTKKILFQNQFSQTVVETVAKDIGAQCVAIDPLSENVEKNLILITQIITSR